MNAMLLIPVLLPVAAGLLEADLPACRDAGFRHLYVSAVLAVNALCVLFLILCGGTSGMLSLSLFEIVKDVPVALRLDGLAALFIGLVSVMWLAAGVFSFEYMKHEGNEVRYDAFYLISLGALIGLGLAANFVTLYLCFEFMTLLTMPMVLHSGTPESVAAAKKYLFYSIFGASVALLGLFFMSVYGASGTAGFFTPGGVLDAAKLAGHESWLLVVVFLTIVGFGAKAGMFPLHSWLPTAHPVAPAPASAVLSGVITKAGVLAIIRVVFYQVGVDFVRGTWVQAAWMILALVTVFMGSMLAYKEKIFKKRLAYSTVSQVSYVLFGLSVMNQTAVLGALLHVIFHSVIKDVLFLSAGAVIYKTGITDVRGLKGIGKQMPVTMWCFTIVSLALIGIPPLCGFVSKWYLATGSLDMMTAGTAAPALWGALSWIGPVVLLASALLTAGYLFSITIQAFFPGADYDYTALKKTEPNLYMTAPLVVLTAAAVLFGIFPQPLIWFLSQIVSAIV